MGTKTNRKNKRTTLKVSAVLNLPSDQDVVIGKGVDQRSIKPLSYKNENQKLYMECIDKSIITFGCGSAGSGKTYIAVCKAIDALKSQTVKKIVLSRPAVEAGGEKFGFLPGDLKEKIEPYLIPIYDILYERLGRANVHDMIHKGIIDIVPLAFMRGRTLSNSFIIFDEMQNTTIDIMKMALTRFGDNCKVVITGDPSQSDKKFSSKGSASDFLKMIDVVQGMDNVSIVKFDQKDVVRSEIVAELLARFEKNNI